MKTPDHETSSCTPYLLFTDFHQDLRLGPRHPLRLTTQRPDLDGRELRGDPLLYRAGGHDRRRRGEPV